MYERRYPACTEEPVRREGATGPERPKRMRPDGAVCYVEGKHGGLGVKRRNVQQGEQRNSKFGQYLVQPHMYDRASGQRLIMGSAIDRAESRAEDRGQEKSKELS